MKNKMIKFKSILNLRDNVASLAANVAKIEADIVIAEQCLADARRDDGITEPAEIVARSEEARRTLEIRRIEGNREAAKLAEAEEQYGDLICKQAPVIIEHLHDVSSKATEKIIEQALTIFGGITSENQHLKALVSQLPEVSDPIDVARRIRSSFDFFTANQILKPDLTANVLSAERFL
jgi:hypothetical protein